jgi:xanthine dehydrogenase YagR molybdenum-binding subunit
VGDTDCPAGPVSGGSCATASISPPARNAAYHVCRQLCALAAPILGVEPEELEARGGSIVSRRDPARAIAFRDAAAKMRTDELVAFASRSDDYAGFRSRAGDGAAALTDIGGVQFAAVTVDVETGLVRVERIVAAHDCGRLINPKSLSGNIMWDCRVFAA